MRKALRARTWWTLTGAWALVIFGLSSIPGRAFPKVEIANLDKVVHMGLYGVLGALAACAVRKAWGPGKTTIRLVLMSAVLATAYGISDEVHQLWVPGRSADVRDVAADAIGGTVGAVAGALL